MIDFDYAAPETWRYRICGLQFEAQPHKIGGIVYVPEHVNDERIAKLEQLLRDMQLLDCIVTGYGRPCESLCPMFHECRSNVCERARCLLREDIEKRMKELGIMEGGA